MASVTWISSASGNWNNSANWSPNIPGPGDDATIGVAGTVTVTVTTQEIANSLTLASAGDTLSVSSGLTIGSTLAINAGTLALNGGGAIVGGTITGGGVQFHAGTLSGVTYVGALDLSASNSRVVIQNGITLTPTGGSGPDSVLVTGQFSYLDFAGSQTLSNAAIILGSAGNTGSLRELTTGGVLTLDNTTSVTMQGRGALNSFGGTIVNAGSITAGVSNGYVNVSGALTNQGAINVLNGSNWNSSNAVFNNVVGGTFALGAGSSAILGNGGHSFSNQGTITLATGAALRLGGYFQQSSIGAISNSGGTVDITGTLGNFGNTLTTGAGSNIGTVELDGTIVGGTITGGGVQFHAGTLSGVTYVGALDLSASNSRVIIQNGITLTPSGGSGPDSVLVTGQFSYLDFAGSQTLSNAAISLGNGGTTGSLRELTTGATLTLDNTTSINLTGRGSINSFGGTIVNAGLITAGFTGGYVGVSGALTNLGEIDVLNATNLVASNAVFNNAAGGSFALGAGSSVTLGNSSRTFANQGTITLATAAALRLGGYFSQGNIGAITNSGGTVDITGTLNNVGSTLVTGSSSSLGTVQLDGTIVGGTIVGSGLVFNGGTLSGVTLVGPLDLSRNNSRVIVTNGITLGTAVGANGGADAVLVTGQFSYLDFAGSQTLSNAAISLGNGGTTGSLRELTAGGTLTLATSTSVNLTGRGEIDTFGGTLVNAGTITAGFTSGYANFTGTFINRGEIDVLNGLNLSAANTSFTNAPGGVIAIGASSSATFGNTNRGFSNQSTITVAAGGVLRLAGFSTEGDLGTITNTGGTVDIAGTLNNVGTVLSTGNGSGLGTVQLDGTIVGGTITGGRLVFNGGTLSGVTYVGPLDLSAANSRLSVINGINLSPVGGSGPDAVLVTGQFSYLDFVGSQTLSNAAVSLGGATSPAFVRELGSNATLTLDPTVTINAVGRAGLLASGDTIVNAGSITAGVTNGYFNINGAFTNEGSLAVGNGTNLVASGATFTNATGATFSIGANSSATIGSTFDPFANQGTIGLGSAALLNLGGSFNTGSIGLVNNAGGTISIDGTLINTGSVLSTGAAGLGAVALHGTVVGGTITGGGMLFAGGTLSGVDYIGPLDLSRPSSHAFVTNGITLTPNGGAGLDPVLITSSFSYLDFNGTQTLANAAVTIGSTSGTSFLREIGASSVLTLDPTVTITQAGRSFLGIALNTSTIVNQGTIAIGVTSSYFGLGGDFVNQGAISISGGGYLTAPFSAFDNAAGGTLSIGANSGAWIGFSNQSFSNQGSISLGTSAYLRLGGSFSTGDIGAVTNAGGTVSVLGTLDNTGAVLTTGTGAALGLVKLTGTVVGGTVAGGGMLFGSGTLSGVSYVGPLDLSQASERVIVTNGITLNPAGGSGPDQVLLTGEFAYLNFTGSQTFSNAAVSFGAEDGLSALSVFGAGSVVTLDPTVSIIQTGHGGEIYAFSGATMINAGTISAGVTDGFLSIFGNFVNQGVINVAHGETLSIATLTGAGSVNLASGAALTVSTAVGSGEVIRFADQTGRLTINQAGSFAGSIQGFRTGDAVDLTNIGTAASYSYDSALHQLTLSNAGGTQIAQVSLATSLINPQFTLAGDFSNGTLVTVTGAAGGTLTGVYNQGIVLSNPDLQNPTVIAASAYIGNYSDSNGGDALYGTDAAAWRITNYGTIRGTASSADGIDLRAGGTIINRPGSGTGGTISGGVNGVYIGGAPGTVANYGAITGGSFGVAAIDLAAGGSVTNGQAGSAAGAITGYLTGVYAAGSGNTVVNFGTIGATGSISEGVHFGSGGTVINAQSAAVISGGIAGIDIEQAPGIVVNLGTIIGGGANGLGLYLGGGHSTVTNIGRIAGNSGIAVLFGGTGNRLIVDPGAVFAGGLNGGDGGGTLELEAGGATGSIGGLGTAITGFDTVQVDTGANWRLTGSNALGLNGTLSNAGTLDVVVSLSVPGQLVNDGVIDIADAAVLVVGDDTGGTGTVAFTGTAGTFEIDGTAMPSLTIAGFGPDDTIDLRAIAGGNTGTGSVGADNLLTVVEGGTQYDLQLDPAQSFAGQSVLLSDDGFGGTFIRISNSPLVVSSGQTFTVESGQTFNNILVLSGGLLNVLSGGTAIATTDNGAELLSGGVETGAVISNGGSLSVSAGGVLSNASAAANGEIFVLSGGLAVAPGIASGGVLTVETGGTANSAIVSNGGSSVVTGVVSGVVVNSGGQQFVSSGGTATATTVNSGGLEHVEGLALGTVIGSQGLQLTESGGVASGVTVANAGQEIVLAGGTVVDMAVAGGSVDLQVGAAATGTISFTAPAGVLNIDGPTMPAATIVGFDRSDVIDLTGFAPQTGNTVAFDPGSGVLTVSGNGITETLVLSGVASLGGAFALVADGSGGTRIEAVPPAPAGLVLQPGSDSGVPGDDVTNVTAPVITGSGEAGDTISLFDGNALVGTGTVQPNGSWAVAAGRLGEGAHSLTAVQTDAGGKVGAASAALPLRIDLAAPLVGAASLQVSFNSAATPLGIPMPTDADDTADALSVVVTALPGNGTVTLSDGVTPVGLSQSLTIAQLAGLEFTPGGVAKIGTTGTFGYRVGDPAGNLAAGSASLSVVASGSTTLYDFVFTYADGKDYYLGTVADDGRFGYQVGQTIAAGAGSYSIYNAQPMTTEPAGTVVVLSYSHGGAGQASTLPARTAAGQPDGATGLGSETDTVPGTDGAAHPFSSSAEASFGTIALSGFTYTYADGAAYYSGTVADDGTLTPGTKTVTDGSGNVLGTYMVFADGVTTRAPGTVVVDRFTARDTSLMPIHATAASVDGTQGLGSEVGSIPGNAGVVSFGAALEPSFAVNIVPVVAVPPPSTADVLTGEVTELFQEILGRDPVSVELSTYSAELANGLDVGSLRQTLAQSLEAQGDVNQLYQQILDRPGDPAGLANYTAELINGATLATVQLLIAQSPEAQADINQIYLDVFGTGADGFGLTSAMGGLANGIDINTVRSLVTHSPAAADALTTLFGAAIGRTPDMAELAGMEDQLGVGATRTTLANTLAAHGGAGGFTAVTAGTGSTALTAAAGTPTEFVFGNIAFGADTITGFDPARDAVVLPRAVVADLNTLQAETAAIAGGTLIALSPGQSITVAGVSPDMLSSSNFRIV